MSSRPQGGAFGLRRTGGKLVTGVTTLFGRPLASRAQAKLAVSLDKPLRFGDVTSIDRGLFSIGKTSGHFTFFFEAWEVLWRPYM